MKKALSLILALVMCLSMCACGKSDDGSQKDEEKSPIVGVWRYKLMGTTFTYHFKSDGTFTYTVDGIDSSSEMKDTGKYTYNEEDGTITLNIDNGDELTKDVEIRDCCLITRENTYGEVFEQKYGKVYSDSDNCEVLDVLLGKWKHTVADTYLEFNKDGTYSISDSTGSASGLYVYDPVLKKVELSGELIFEFEETSDGIELYATNMKGLYFKRA